MTWLRWTSSLALATLLALPRVAHAEPNPADRAAAEALFRDAKRLMGKKSWPDACRKLEESQRLDPQGGTLLNLAVCHAREGRTASAWVEFQEAATLAREQKRRDRMRLATRELKALENSLSRLTIEVPESARVPGLRIERGGEAVGQGAWGTPVPIDPDLEIDLVASAEGYREYRTTVSASKAEQKTIVIPKLEKLPPEAPPPKAKAPVDHSRDDRDSGRKTRRLVAYVAGGVGVIGVGLGTYFGLRAVSKNSASEKHCDGKLCDPDGLELNDQADRAATISNVSFGVGILGLGVGTYFFLSSMPDGKTKPAESDTAFHVVPSLGLRSANLLVTRSF